MSIINNIFPIFSQICRVLCLKHRHQSLHQNHHLILLISVFRYLSSLLRSKCTTEEQWCLFVSMLHRYFWLREIYQSQIFFCDDHLQSECCIITARAHLICAITLPFFNNKSIYLLRSKCKTCNFTRWCTVTILT